ncbi:hypothetical protein HELRODRAFT_87114 [Helobdella robusta]|uniref:Headcase middle domain-containing protein n=1 Tax=Helobdella robusta TaxID=6412 RepID=T1G6L8_HELRO|nr:hypothetical protein HELRODRAFT_87114 [Helobdella robusta]ESN95126.1 hypothetical protein HELRODRAFT_87114 [Helobdella robusta]
MSGHLLNYLQVEDEGPHGNDEIRSFLLTQLSYQNVTDVFCCVCVANLHVYDKYPLIDGTFFLSPFRYSVENRLMTSSSSPPRSSSLVDHVTPIVEKDSKKFFLNAICVDCLSRQQQQYLLQCCYCNRPWQGSNLIIGSMYSYDIFAAQPCCQARLLCNNNNNNNNNNNKNNNNNNSVNVRFFSDYSQSLACPHCGVVDSHFVKPLSQTFLCAVVVSK